ncbi:MAG: HutD/Ves family protein [Luteimonas sp.]
MHRQPLPPLAGYSRIIPGNDYVRSRWCNGAGWTREILRAPDDASGSEAWHWRLSIAEIEQPAAFSPFPGIERELVLLHGNGLRLRFERGPDQVLHPPHGRCRFHGGDPVVGEPVEGVVHAFNLMWRRDALAADLWHRPLVGPMVVFVDPGSCWTAHLIAGEARISGDATLPPMAGGDTAVLLADGARARYVIEGGGEVLLVRIDPAG